MSRKIKKYVGKYFKWLSKCNWIGLWRIIFLVLAWLSQWLRLCWQELKGNMSGSVQAVQGESGMVSTNSSAVPCDISEGGKCVWKRIRIVVKDLLLLPVVVAGLIFGFFLCWMVLKVCLRLATFMTKYLF